MRLEPWVANVIYVQIDKGWVAAIARNQRPYAGRTRRSVEVALREENRRSKQSANKDTISKEQLKKKERLWSPETFDARIDAQQNEMVYLFRRLGMAEALPIEPNDTGHEFASTGPTNSTAPLVEKDAGACTEPPVAINQEEVAKLVSPSALDMASSEQAEQTDQPSLLGGIDGLF